MTHRMLVLFLIVLTPMLEAQEEALKKGAMILDAMDVAIGDVNVRKTRGTLLMVGEFSMQGMEGKGTIREAWRGRHEVLWTHQWPMMGGSSQGLSATMAWTTDPAMGIYIAEGADRETVARYYHACALIPWRELFREAEYLGEVTLQDQVCDHIKTRGQRGRDMEWFVGRTTRLPVAFEVELPDMLGGWLKMNFRLSEWKDIRGVKFPHLREQKIGKYLLTHRYVSITPDAPLKDEDLLPPKKVQEAAAKPRKRSAVPPEKPSEPFVEEIDLRHTVSIRMQVSAQKISESLAIMLPEVAAYVSKNSGVMAGPPYSRYHGEKDGMVDLEAGLPVAEVMAGEGRVKAGVIPGALSAVSWHFGPFTGLTQAHANLKAWIKSANLKENGPAWEVYWTDPGIEPDPAKWKTQIFVPVSR